MTLEEKVETKIASLLALVVDENVDQESYEFVLGKLTKLALLGTAPANCAPKGCAPKACKKKARREAAKTIDTKCADGYDEEGDFASRKEAFIAP